MRDVRETMFDCIELKKKKIHKEIKYLSIMTGL